MILSSRPVWACGVKAHRQMQHVVEIGRHLDHPAPMGEAVGIQGDRDAGHDGEDAEARPGREPGPDPRPLQRVAGAHRPGELVDDLAEQHRLGELRHRERDIGDDQRRREPLLRPEPAEDPGVKPDEIHARAVPADRPQRLRAHVAFRRLQGQNHADGAAEVRPTPRARRRHGGRGGLPSRRLSRRARRVAPPRAPARPRRSRRPHRHRAGHPRRRGQHRPRRLGSGPDVRHERRRLVAGRSGDAHVVAEDRRQRGVSPALSAARR